MGEQGHSKRGKRRKHRRRQLILIAVLLIALLAAAALLVRQVRARGIALNGEQAMEIGLYGVYEEPGATAERDGEDVSDEIEVSGEVDTSRPGRYQIRYTLDGATATRTVTVGEEMNPVLELKGEDSYDIKLGEDFAEPGYTATDADGQDLTDQVTVSYDALNTAGEAQLAYTVTDAEGNRTRRYRTVTVAANTDYDTPGLAITMYHYVYDESDPPEDLNANYISAQDLEEELNWLQEQGYYYPSWQEVRDYVDGKLKLPDKSIVLCFDDGALSFLEEGIPVLEKCEVPATCFMITSHDGAKRIETHQSEYVQYQSHSDNMHRAGGSIGHGGIFTAISEEEGLADLEKSIEICGSGEAFAYPFGDYNDRCRAMVEEAGFLCAMTTEYGKVYPGDDPLLLPRVRMSEGQSLDAFISRVAP